MSVYDPFSGRYSMYRSPSVRSYYSHAPSSPYSAYSDDWYSRALSPGVVSDRVYFSLNGKLIRAYKIRSYRVRRSCLRAGPILILTRRPLRPNRIQRAQKHVLDLYPDMLQGIASSRIQFYVTRPAYSNGQYVGFKSYISKHAWLAEVDGLAEHETVGIEVRPSVSFSESVSSFFNRTRFV